MATAPRDATLDFYDSRRNFIEQITPHKICVIVFIREYCHIKQENEDNLETPKYSRTFNMLALKLIQSPDLEYDELYTMLFRSGQMLYEKHIKLFQQEISKIYENGLHTLLDISLMMDKLMVDPINSTAKCVINKSSIIGLYLRRVMLSLDRLSFNSVAQLTHAFRAYIDSGQQKLLGNGISDDMDIMEIEEDPFLVPKAKNMFSSEKGIWSRKQADLFIAEQTNLLQTNEIEALSPRKLHEIIKKLVATNKDYGEAHFLSYLNCLRTREFCGAVSSLYHSFDKGFVTDEKSREGKGFRYSALNLGMLHSQFKNNEETRSAIKEAITLAQECGDNVCIQYALSCLAHTDCLEKNETTDMLLQRAVTRSIELSLSHTASLAMQARVQSLALQGSMPQALFEVMRRSDIVNCQNSLVDQMSNSYAEKAAMWHLYGKSDMASIFSQLLLNLNTNYMTQGDFSFSGEGTCLAVCNVCRDMQHPLSSVLLSYAREKFPRSPMSESWMLTEHIKDFEYYNHLDNWQDAEQSTNQLLSLNPWESLLLKGTLNISYGDYPTANVCVEKVINECVNDPNLKFVTDTKIRAMILSARVNRNPIGSIGDIICVLNTALALSSKHFLNYHSAMLELNLAHVQLKMGLPNQALKLLNRSLFTVISNSNAYDNARALLLFVKCQIAARSERESEDEEIFLRCLQMLNQVREYFESVNAFSNIKELLYLQALMYDEIHYVKERNNAAFAYRLLCEEHPECSGTSIITSF